MTAAFALKGGGRKAASMSALLSSESLQKAAQRQRRHESRMFTLLWFALNLTFYVVRINSLHSQFYSPFTSTPPSHWSCGLPWGSFQHENPNIRPILQSNVLDVLFSHGVKAQLGWSEHSWRDFLPCSSGLNEFMCCWCFFVDRVKWKLAKARRT